MEVELSGETEPDATCPVIEEPEPEENKTPRRAAEVFGFLTERRKSVLERQRSQLQRAYAAPAVPSKDDAPPLPALTVPQASPNPDISDTSIISTLAQIHTATITKLTPVLNPLSRSTDALNLLYNTHIPVPSTSTTPCAPARTHLTGASQTSLVSTASSSQSKIPRGPRPLPHPNTTPHTKPPHAKPAKHTELPTPAPHCHARHPCSAQKPCRANCIGQQTTIINSPPSNPRRPSPSAPSYRISENQHQRQRKHPSRFQ